MATRIKITRRLYSGIPETMRRAAGYIKKNPTLPIVTTSLGVTTANLSTNKRRNKQEEKSRSEYIGALNRLSNSLEKAEERVIEAEPNEKDKTPNKQRTIIIKRRK